jgi:hypothetical protein
MTLLTVKEFAEALEVSAQRVRQLIEKGHLEKTSSGKISLKNKKNKEYLDSRQKNQKFSNAQPKKNTKVDGVSKAVDDIIKNANSNLDKNEKLISKLTAEEFLELPPGKITSLFSPSNADILIKVAKAQVDLRRRDLETKKELNEWVHVSEIEKIVFHYLNALNKKILGAPVTIVDRIIATVKTSGQKSRQKIIKLMTETASKNIKDTKSEMSKFLRKAKK